jgi:DnaJ-domain-containing protein 1
MESILDIHNQDVSDYSIQSEPVVSDNGQETLWDRVKNSYADIVPEEALLDLGKEIPERQKGNKRYMMSWLSSHQWQLATTKGKPSNYTAFRTIEQQRADEGTNLVSCLLSYYRRPTH